MPGPVQLRVIGITGQDSANDVLVSDGVMIDGYDQIYVARSRRERLLTWINHL
ncbi:hypothetical protein SynBIOSE41_00986 [Synechococcus sp. BIOS-E4-1]|nr:hypothetical protein SynBIOSE41_00986 [Synechococcus sp. BIOS-E4-1]